jgi:hypothetical protein
MRRRDLDVTAALIGQVTALARGWTHYRILMSIERPEARGSYEIEAAREHWSVRELERQIVWPAVPAVSLADARAQAM